MCTIQDGILYGKKNSDPVPNIGVGRFIQNRLLQLGDAPAQIYHELDGMTFTFREVAQRAAFVAHELKSKGVGPGDIVALSSYVRPEFMPIMFGVLLRGATFGALNPAYDSNDFKHVLGILDPKLIITEPGASASRIREHAKKGVEVLEMKESGAKDWFRCLYNGTEEEMNKLVNVEDIDSYAVPDVPDVLERTALIYFSSGTTGFPKGVMTTHGNLLFQFISSRKNAGPGMLDSVYLQATALFWFSGTAMQLMGFVGGNLLVSLTGFKTDVFLDAVDSAHVNFTFIPPNAAVTLAKTPGARDKLKSMKVLGVGGASMDGQTQKFVQEALGVIVGQWFAMTEVLMVVAPPPDRLTPSGSVGFIQMNMAAKIVDPETRKILGPNERGEIAFKGPTLTPGYYKNPEATASAIDEEGWFYAGDVAYYDQEGFIFVVDRIKDLIKFCGHHVVSIELESILLSHPAVKEATVIGIPNDQDQEHPRAYVVKQTGSVVTEEELVKFVEDQVADYKRLRGGVRFIDIIPRTATAKVAKIQLRELAKQELSSENMDKENGVLQGPVISTELPNLSLGKYLFRQMLEHGDALAQVYPEYENEKFTFSDIAGRAANVAQKCLEMGIGEGDVVCLATRIRPEFTPLMVGILLTGSAISTLNPDYDNNDLKNAFSILNPKLIISEPGDTVIKIKKAAKPEVRIIEMRCNGNDYWERLTRVQTNVDDVKLKLTDDDPDCRDKPAIIIFSSGTSGPPKAVIGTNGNWISCIMNNRVSPMFKKGFTHMQCTSVFWTTGILNQILQIDLGNTLVIVASQKEDLLAKRISDFKINRLFCPPYFAIAMSQNFKSKHYNLSSIQAILVGGSPMDLKTQKAVQDALNVPISQAYGMTEIIYGIGPTETEFPPLGSIGALQPNFKAKVVDGTGKSLGANQMGELVLKGPLITPGYYNNPHASAKIFDENGWFHTGDIVYYDDDEWFFIVERAKDLIKYRGNQIFPNELEGLLRSHASVKEVAVIGIPNALDQEHPRAYVVLKEGHQVSKEELIDIVKKNMADYKHLRGGIVYIDQLPKTASGKISKGEIRRRAMEGMDQVP